MILGDEDKVTMDDELRERVAERRGTRVICRSGVPSDLAALEIVNIQGSRSIIVLPPAGPDADTVTIKTLLAITNSPTCRPEPYHVVAEIREAKNFAVAQMVGRDEVELVLVPDLLARVTVQTCRQPGLSVVYQELLDFGGDETYFAAAPGLVGRPLRAILLGFEDSTVIGIHGADGVVRLLPPLDTRLAAGDEVVAISADNDTVRPRTGAPPPIEEGAIVVGRPRTAQPENTLILGWSRRVPLLLRELDAYVAPGSPVRVVGRFVDGI